MGEKRQGQGCCWIEKWIFNCEWERGFVGVSCYAWRLVYISCFHNHPCRLPNFLALIELLVETLFGLYVEFSSIPHSNCTVFRLVVRWEAVRWLFLFIWPADAFAVAWSAWFSFPTLQLLSEVGFTTIIWKQMKSSTKIRESLAAIEIFFSSLGFDRGEETV